MLHAEPKLWWYYENVEKPLVPIIIGMHERGVRIDA
jgi:DNA polymerase I-like protein with 3'-5' exonuclease and polymerase domains